MTVLVSKASNSWSSRLLLVCLGCVLFLHYGAKHNEYVVVAFTPTTSSSTTKRTITFPTTTTTTTTTLWMDTNTHPKQQTVVDSSSMVETTTKKKKKKNHDNLVWKLPNVMSAMVLTACLWASPSMILAQQQQQQQQSQQQVWSNNNNNNNNNNHNSVWVENLSHTFMASAKEKASGTGSRVNKDPESLLRYGLPIHNKEVRTLQEALETIKYDIGSKRKAAALDGVKTAKSYLSGAKADKILAGCGSNSKVCAALIQELDTTLTPLQIALKESQDAFTGSEQERIALDKAYIAQESSTKLLTKLEEQMIPPGYKTPVPAQYQELPQLTKRATVEMTFAKATPGDVFQVNSKNYPTAKMVMIIDGYTAPITGGNFVDLVNRGFYNNMKIQRSDGFVVQTGDPDGPAIGFTGGTPSKAIGAGPNGERLIPTEIFIKGDKGPFYESTIEDEGRGGEATVLPFSSFGAMGWARDEYDVNSGSSQFFWLLFDSDLTPAGKNVLDGRYPCFGYVVEGADFLTDLKEGDVIVSAKVTEGLEYLVQPK